jgi:hypothetical protein
MSEQAEVETEETQDEIEATVDGGLSRLSLPASADLEEDELVAPLRRDER